MCTEHFLCVMQCSKSFICVSISGSPHSHPTRAALFLPHFVDEGTETEWLNDLSKDTLVVVYGPGVCRQEME